MIRALFIGGVVAVAGGLFYVWVSLYRIALRILRDPDTERLLDGE